MVSLIFAYMTMVVGISLTDGIPDAVVCSCHWLSTSLHYLTCPLFYCLCFW